MPTKSEQKRCKNCKNFYCGNAERLPKGYYKFGSRFDCLRSGVGIGLYVLPKKKTKESRKIRKKKIRDDEELDEDDIKAEHQEFYDKNFKKVYKETKQTDKGQIFKKLAILWTAKNS